MKNINTMKKKQKKIKWLDNTDSLIPCGNITYIIAFVIPLMVFIALYYLKDIYPFGDNCYLRSDMYHQYAPFFSELWDKLRNGESLTYSWDIGMGTNFTSLAAYYLSSPMNLLIALFPQKSMIEIMNVLIILKLSLSSVTFTYYITKHFRNKSCIISLFGMFYSMSAFVAAYSWNIMWLDCIILVPLIMLGLEKLVNEDKYFLYCISLGLCILSNYYISIMVCLSVIMYFIVLIISYNGKKSAKIYFKKIFNWGIFSLLAAGLAACLLLPEIYTFSLSASSSISFPKKLEAYFSVMEMLVRQLMQVPVHLGLEHYPNIYCGVAIFLLIPLYICNKNIKTNEKIGKCVMLLAFLLAFNLNIPNFIWHGLHYPNSLPCRQSYIYIFFVLTMAYEGYYHIKDATRRNISFCVWIAAAFLLITEQMFIKSEDYKFTIFYISGAYMLGYALALFIKHKKKSDSPIALFIVFALAITECALNMQKTGLGTTDRPSYLLDYNAVKNVTTTVNNDDSSFYRMDKIWGARSKNDGAWHNYHSISTFSSTCSAGMSDLFKDLGMYGSTNAYSYDGATLLTNSLFSVKYLISNQLLATDSLLTYYTGNDGEFIYRNENTLPLGYVVYSDVNEWKGYDINNGIENQNTLIYSMTGKNNVFREDYNYTSASDITITPKSDGHMYLYVQNSETDLLSVTVGTDVKSFRNLKNDPHLIDVGYVTTNDSVQIGSDKETGITVYMLDTNIYKQICDTLSQNGFMIDSWSDTQFDGTVHCDYDGTFMFSIPFDKGWSVYIDGKKVDTYPIANALLGADITQGSHDVQLKYIPVNLIKGCIITILSILILIGLYILKRNNITPQLLYQKLLEKSNEDTDNQDNTHVNNIDSVLKMKNPLRTLNVDKISDNFDNKNDFEHSEKNINTQNLSEFLEDIDDFDSLELDDENN